MFAANIPPTYARVLVALVLLPACGLENSFGWTDGSSSGAAGTVEPEPTDGPAPTGGAAQTSALASTSSDDAVGTGSGSSSGGEPPTATGEVTTGGATSTGGGSTGSGSSGSTGGELPEYCDGPMLDYGCLGQKPTQLAITIDAGLTVDANTSADIVIDTSTCGDPTRPATGLVVDVGLADACLFSMKLGLACPSGQVLDLLAPEGCGACSDVAKEYRVIFRTTAPAECSVCDFADADACLLRPVGQDLCEFLASCDFASGEPWKLHVEAGDSPLTVTSVGLRLLLDD